MDKLQDDTPSIVGLAMPAIQRGIQKALIRHRKLGESIVIMRDGEIVTLTGDEIPISVSDQPADEANP
jgi:hypothetical protein